MFWESNVSGDPLIHSFWLSLVCSKIYTLQNMKAYLEYYTTSHSDIPVQIIIKPKLFYQRFLHINLKLTGKWN